jgi:REP element-mobilizing transposase RayT
MKMIDPVTGRTYYRKRRRRYNEAGEPRELTFCCFHGHAFLSRDRTREWFCDALEAARREFNVQLWAYVIMPEHVHLLVVPNAPTAIRPETRVARPEALAEGRASSQRPLSQGTEPDAGASARPSHPAQGGPPARGDSPAFDADNQVSRFLQALKEPVARKALAHLRRDAPHWLPRLRVQESQRTRHRFWQPGGGYDRNILETATLQSVIDYIHANPVRRGLVERPEDWEWSSARWFAGLRPVKIEMDPQVLIELQYG